MVTQGCTLGLPISGESITGLVLAGWSATLPTWTTNGKVWWRLAAGVLTVYRNDGTEATDRLCSGSVVDGKATLAALNTSGITGVAMVPNGIPDSHGPAIVSYANETHLNSVSAQLSGFLATGNKWPTASGGNRFEEAFDQARQELEGWVQRQGAGQRAPRWMGRVDLTRLADPWQLAVIHALLTADVLQSRSATLNPAGREEADAYRRRAKDRFQNMVLVWKTGWMAAPLTAPRLVRG